MRRFFLALLIVAIPLAARAATLSTDDTSATNILTAYLATLNAGTPPNPVCAPNCQPSDAVTNMVQGAGAQAAAFAQQYLQAQAIAAAPTVPVVTAPH